MDSAPRQRKCPMTDPDSITRWFHRLQNGDDAAATELWKHYFPRLIAVARNRFDADRNPVYDADDAVASVLGLLCRGAREGRFRGVDDRDQLWRLLVTATRRKVIDQVRRSQATKRGGHHDILSIGDELAAPQPTPETLAIMDESLTRLLSSLRDDTLRCIALRRLEGYSNAEIAAGLNVSERTIERKLNLIRGDWEKLV